MGCDDQNTLRIAVKRATPDSEMEQPDTKKPKGVPAVLQSRYSDACDMENEARALYKESMRAARAIKQQVLGDLEYIITGGKDSACTLLLRCSNGVLTVASVGDLRSYVKRNCQDLLDTTVDTFSFQFKGNHFYTPIHGTTVVAPRVVEVVRAMHPCAGGEFTLAADDGRIMEWTERVANGSKLTLEFKALPMRMILCTEEGGAVPGREPCEGQCRHYMCPNYWVHDRSNHVPSSPAYSPAYSPEFSDDDWKNYL